MLSIIIGQVGDASRSYYQGQRLDPRMALERQGLKDPRSQPREEDMEVGYEDNLSSQTFEGLEQKFLDDIMKLSKEQTDAEDAENARHRQDCIFHSMLLICWIFAAGLLYFFFVLLLFLLGVIGSSECWVHYCLVAGYWP
ncbi:unnamed protein product [Ilex paraguariensis]|uniref:Uncharacterized protein n=1 Tax=Ilex paraguariensis TaxID=185542 RepID=A0ABC8UUA7_9AQUA